MTKAIALFAGDQDARVVTDPATGFAYLTVFCLARLFASVGLWIKASWGAVLLAGGTVVELALYLFGNKDVQMTAFGFAVRVVLVVSVAVLFGLSLRMRRAHD